MFLLISFIEFRFLNSCPKKESFLNFVFKRKLTLTLFSKPYNHTRTVKLRFVITSVAVIPAGESRRIQTFSVFIVTMFFSLFAYVWLLIILVGSSPYRVEVWEAGATLGFIPVIILFSYAAEKGWLDWLFCQNRKSRKVKPYFVFILMFTYAMPR